MNTTLEVSNITYNDTLIDIAGLDELLSSPKLWEKPTKGESDYTRKVIQHDGKTRTLLIKGE